MPSSLCGEAVHIRFKRIYYHRMWTETYERGLLRQSRPSSGSLHTHTRTHRIYLTIFSFIINVIILGTHYYCWGVVVYVCVPFQMRNFVSNELLNLRLRLLDDGLWCVEQGAGGGKRIIIFKLLIWVLFVFSLTGILYQNVRRNDMLIPRNRCTVLRWLAAYSALIRNFLKESVPTIAASIYGEARI